MRKIAQLLELTATDLVGFLNCRYLSRLDLAVAEGALSEPDVWDPTAQAPVGARLGTRGGIRCPLDASGRWMSPGLIQAAKPAAKPRPSPP